MLPLISIRCDAVWLKEDSKYALLFCISSQIPDKSLFVYVIAKAVSGEDEGNNLDNRRVKEMRRSRRFGNVVLASESLVS